MASVPVEERGAAPRALGELVRGLIAGPDQETLRRLIGKSVAVSSGKGGVGKTITACNLAISYARRGLRVGLVDLDPLSDVATLLDLQEAEQALTPAGGDGQGQGDGLGAFLLPVFRGLDILFPAQKLGDEEMAGLLESIYRRHLSEIDARYELVLFDMPAGMSYHDNLAWLPFMARLVLVTNPEPTAHASAGAYAKEVQRLYPGTTIYLWHNRFSGRTREGFPPRDVSGNYNRFVEAGERLTPRECSLMTDIAFVPEDPALDLLHGEPSPAIHVLKCMRDCLDYAHGRLLSQAARKLGVSRRIQDVVSAYIHHNPEIGAPAEYLSLLGAHLGGMVAAASDAPGADAPGVQPFTAEEEAVLEGFVGSLRKSVLRREILHLLDALSEQVRQMEEARGTFASRLPVVPDRAMDRELARFLVRLSRAAGQSALLRNQGVLLLFYFSLHKLFQSPTLVRVIRGLVPRKTNSRGRRVRDRFRQIRSLVEQDADYRRRYLKTIRSIYALVARQVFSVTEAFGLHALLIKTAESRLDAHAYLKLLSAFLHETVYSGLSVIVGFEYRSAAVAFQAGAEKLLSSFRQGPAGNGAP